MTLNLKYLNFFKLFSFSFFLLLISYHSFSQTIGIGTTAPDSSALLEFKSTTKGLLIPSMTSLQRNNIANPAEGLLVYQTDVDTGFNYYSGSQWKRLGMNSSVRSNAFGRNIFLYIKKYEGLPRPPEEVWVANFDGNGAHRIPIPDSLTISHDACLSPDGGTVFFNGRDTILGGITNIYSCNLDGSNLRKAAAAGFGFDYEVRTAASSFVSDNILDTIFVFFSRRNINSNQHEIWRANIEGTNEALLSIALPGDYVLDVNGDGGQITVIGSKRKILFKAASSSFGYSSLFMCI